MIDEDARLLSQYIRDGSQLAFASLMTRHLNWMHSAAMRIVRNPQLAEDVTQATFIILARKAGTISTGTPLSAWLFRTLRYAAKDVMKLESRRARHEKAAANLPREDRSAPDLSDVLAFLEDAVGGLKENDRRAILLRYYEGQSVARVGAALGLSENGAKKKLARALERLRELFSAKGVTLSGAVLATVLAEQIVQPAPANVLTNASATVFGGQKSAAAELADHVLSRSIRARSLAALSIALLAAFLAIVFAFFIPANDLQTQITTAPPPPPSERTAISLAGDPAQGNSFLPGWPLALPGSVTGTPTVADLDGDGSLELLVPAMYGSRSGELKLAHPTPNIERLLFAFHADGSVMQGWPVIIMNAAARQATRIDQPGFSEDWSSSPSVMDWDHDGRDEVMITNRAGTIAIEQEQNRPRMRQVDRRGDGWASPPLVDVNGDGNIDVLLGSVVAQVDGKPVANWTHITGTPDWAFSGGLPHGFAPAIGDVNGDGKMAVFHPHAREAESVIGGYDSTGKPLPGWPRNVTRMCLFGPVLGDVDGDGKMEVVAADQGGHVLAFHANGEPLADTSTDGEIEGVVRSGVSAAGASPTLADLDGDGKAEIIVFDSRSNSIKAWRGMCEGFSSPDGTLVQLPAIQCQGGVTVADLGGDGVMDLFVGTYWVKLQRDGKTAATNMLPSDSPTTTQCTITDLDRDGIADILFGLIDGRIFAYKTGMAYDEKWNQWPTNNGNFRHTGVWEKKGTERR